MGEHQNACGWTDNKYLEFTDELREKKIKLQCPKGYYYEGLAHIGFLYKTSIKDGKLSSAK